MANLSLTPLDIHNKDFSRGLRGYDIDEVNEFLDQVIKDYEAVIRDNTNLQEKIDTLNEKIQHYSDIEESLKKSILVAEQTAEEVKRNANKEAELIIREAEKNADRIVNEALARTRKIAVEVEELKKQASVYRTRFRMLIEAQLEMLNHDEWDEVTSASLNEGIEPVEDDTVKDSI